MGPGLFPNTEVASGRPKNMTLNKDIVRGIAEYSHEQKVILRAIRMKGGKLTDLEFDALFRDSPRKKRKLRFMGHEDWTYMLGSFHQTGDWAKWLNLTQLMVKAGILTVKDEAGVIIYRKAKA